MCITRFCVILFGAKEDSKLPILEVRRHPGKQGSACSKHFPYLSTFLLIAGAPFPPLFSFSCLANRNQYTQPGDPAPSAPAPPTKLVSQNNQNAGGLGIGVYAIGLAFAALAFGIYTYLQKGADAQGTK